MTGAQALAAVARLLQERAGLAFPAGRLESLGYPVRERARACGCPDEAAYLAVLRGPDGPAELQRLLDAATVGETHFLRNPPQIQALRRHVLPDLVAAARRTGRPLRIWSAGCSTGEEAYTLALLVRELVPPGDPLPVQILGTDVSGRALAAAAEATYGARALQLVGDVDRARWFTTGPDERSWTVRPQARELVELRHHNLVAEPPPFPAGELDLVLCRNVTIYFDRETTRTLAGRLHATLRDGGYLFLGHSETLWQISDAFSLVALDDAFVYRRLDEVDDPRRVLPERAQPDLVSATPAAPGPVTPTARSAPRPEPRPRSVLRRIRRRPAAPAPTAPAAAVAPVPAAGDRSAEAVAGLPAALAAARAGRYAEAAELAAAVADTAPLAAPAYRLRGLALANLGRDGEALDSLRRAVYLDPADVGAAFVLAGVLERLGEGAAAARSYRAAGAALAGADEAVMAELFAGRGRAESAALCERLALRAAGAGRPGRAAGAGQGAP